MLLRIRTILGKAGLAAGLALTLADHAAADTFQLTAWSSGTGTFNLDGMFAQAPGPQGVDLPYTLRITTTFTDPEYDNVGVLGTVWRDYASVEVELQVAAVRYTARQQDRYSYLYYRPDAEGDTSRHSLELYVSFAPNTFADKGALWQTMTLPQDTLPFMHTLAPVTLAASDMLDASIMGGVYIRSEDIHYQIGNAVGTAHDMSFAVTAVPEPAGYAMTLLGCAVLAGAGALRARRAAVQADPAPGEWRHASRAAARGGTRTVGGIPCAISAVDRWAYDHSIGSPGAPCCTMGAWTIRPIPTSTWPRCWRRRVPAAKRRSAPCTA